MAENAGRRTAALRDCAVLGEAVNSMKPRDDGDSDDPALSSGLKHIDFPGIATAAAQISTTFRKSSLSSP